MAATWAGKICSPFRRISARFAHRTGAAVYASIVGANDGSPIVTWGNTTGIGLRTQEIAVTVSTPRITSTPGRLKRAVACMDWRSYHVGNILRQLPCVRGGHHPMGDATSGPVRLPGAPRSVQQLTHVVFLTHCRDQ